MDTHKARIFRRKETGGADGGARIASWDQTRPETGPAPDEPSGARGISGLKMLSSSIKSLARKWRVNARYVDREISDCLVTAEAHPAWRTQSSARSPRAFG
jgi:hypothetical protein